MAKLKKEDLYTFSADGRELICHSPWPPRRCDNMIYNNVYFSQIDQNMGGGQEVCGRHMTEEGWLCSVISDQRVIYVRDDETGEYFSAAYTPVCKPCRSYRCISGLNYHTVENVTAGLKVTWRIFIPVERDPVEVWDVRVENLSRRPRRLSLITEMGMSCDGVDLFGGFLYRRADYRPEVNAIYVLQDGERHQFINFPYHNGFITADRKAVSWCTNRDVFLGPRGSLAAPAALEQDLIPRTVTTRNVPTGSLQIRLTVAPGCCADTRFLAGCCDRPPMIGRLRRKYLGGNLDHDRFFEELRRERARTLANVQIKVPRPELEHRFNIWIKQQIHFGTIHCRWGYKGFRDIVQQAQGILAQDPARARAILLKACAHQYADGFALRGWHPIDPLRYADSAQWMISTLAEYLKETGDFALLDRRVKFYDKGAASVYEHMLRALKRLRTDCGAHGLCLIFFGDWNDSLTGAGRKGKGESVWLSMAFCRSVGLMAELAAHLGRRRDAARLTAWGAEMKQALNRHAWDGGWYLCALDDDGQPIGTRRNPAAKIFLNMQSWAQLGRVCGDERWEKCWRNVRKYLGTGWGLLLNWPTYFKPVPNIGRMSYMRPGTCENGTVYTHGNAFMLMALLERGLADEALGLLEEIAPENPRRPLVNQPTTYYNGCHGPDELFNPGAAEHIWCTGSAAWLYLALTEYILGLRRTYDGLIVKPCFPSKWKEASITRTYRGTTYALTIRNPKRKANAPVVALTVDGKSHPPSQPLPLDGKKHEVIAVLG